MRGSRVERDGLAPRVRVDAAHHGLVRVRVRVKVRVGVRVGVRVS